MPYYAKKKTKRKKERNRACHYMLFSHYILFIYLLYEPPFYIYLLYVIYSMGVMGQIWSSEELWDKK